jgi:hypothetical protein
MMNRRNVLQILGAGASLTPMIGWPQSYPTSHCGEAFHGN